MKRDRADQALDILAVLGIVVLIALAWVCTN